MIISNISLQDYFLMEIKKLINNNKIDQAIKLLESKITNNKNNIPYVCELFMLYVKVKKNDKALHLINNSLKNFPNDINLLTLLSNFYFNNHTVYADELINLYLRMISLGQKDPLIYYRLSFLYNNKLDEENSRKFFYLAYDANKKSPKFSLLLQYSIISSILFQFNYSRKQNFYQLYYDKLKDFSELNLEFVNKFQTHRKENKKIRLGFVSGDFRDHPVGIFVKSLLKNLTKDKYEIYLYSTVVKEDEYTKNIKKYCDKYMYVNLAQSYISSQNIYNDSIDILFDLSGHTAHNGLILFKYKPAPVQISWLGYFSSTGIQEMDYFLTSEYCVLPEEEKFFTEKVLKLPNSHLSYDFSEYNVEQTQTYPFEKNNYFTFGVFQSLNKIHKEDMILWKYIFDCFPLAKIILKSPGLSNEKTKQEFINKLIDLDIDINKIEFRGMTSFQEHLEQHNDVDIMLDLYQVSGCTTTCQSLYMGVPVMTLSGYSMTTRYAEQFNKILKLENFIAPNIESFIKRLQIILENKNELKIIKDSLRNKVLNSSIGNPKVFINDFESVIDNLSVKN